MEELLHQLHSYHLWHAYHMLDETHQLTLSIRCPDKGFPESEGIPFVGMMCFFSAGLLIGSYGCYLENQPISLLHSTLSLLHMGNQQPLSFSTGMNMSILNCSFCC